MTSLNEDEEDLFRLVDQTLRSIGCVSTSQHLSDLSDTFNVLSHSGLVKLVSSTTHFPSSKTAALDSYSAEIESRFSKNAHWFTAFDRETNLNGGVLCLSNGKAYSTAAIYNGPSEAKSAVSKLAIQQGVLALPVTDESPTLPKNAVPDSESNQKLLNAIQHARANIQYRFLYIWDDHEHLYGAVLRIWRGHDSDQAFTCAIQPKFSNISLAKCAVATLALSQAEILQFIEQCQIEVESKVTPEMRQYATRTLYNRILNEWKRATGKDSAEEVEWVYTQDSGVVGCEIRFNTPIAYSCNVKPEYRNKADAKVACAFEATSDGVLELLRFGGKEIPLDYVPSEKVICAAILRGEDTASIVGIKRKEAGNAQAELEEGEVAEKGKKRRRRNKSSRKNQPAAVNSTLATSS